MGVIMSATTPRPTFRSRFAVGLAWTLASLFLIGASLWLYAVVTFGPRLQRRLADLQARGEPLTLVEARPTPLPPPRNAAYEYLQVFQISFAPGAAPPERSLAGLTGDELTQLEEFRKTPDAAGLAQARKLLARPSVVKALRTLAVAGLKPHSVFPVEWDDGLTALFPHLAKFRSAERLVMAQALVSAADGDRTAAADWLRLGLRFPRHVTEEPTLIAQLVGYALYALVSDTLPKVLQYGDLPPAMTARLQAELAAPQLNDRLHQALRTERVIGLQTFQQAASDPRALAGAAGMDRSSPLTPAIGSLSRTLFGRPFWQLQQLRYLDRMDEIIPRVLQDYRTVGQIPTPRPQGWDLSAMFTPAYGRIGCSRDQALARLGQMQIALTLNDYHTAHRQYPAALSDLPGKLPLDPFSGQEFVYHPQGSRFLLYSVGGNLKDDGGTVAPEQSDRMTLGDLVWGR